MSSNLVSNVTVSGNLLVQGSFSNVTGLYTGSLSSSYFSKGTGTVIRVYGKVAGGRFHTAVLLEDGTVRTFGRNDQGQLGVNDTTSRLTPVQVWGISSSAVSVACGAYHTAVLLADGTVRTFGFNSQGGLGIGDTTSRLTPVTVVNITTATAVACGFGHTAVVLENGSVQTVGRNGYGQLGINDTTTRNTPVQVSVFTSATALACGREFTAIINEDGTVRTFGFGQYGNLGVNDTASRLTPVQVWGISSSAVNIGCGAFHTSVLLADGTARTFGNNVEGQLGVNDTTSRLTPVQVWGISSSAVNIGCGAYHTAVLLADGTVRTFGRGSDGEIGINIITSRQTPVQVWGISSSAVNIGCGGYITAVILPDRTVRTFGLNNFGQLGVNDTMDRLTPVQVLNITTASQLSTARTYPFIQFPALNLGPVTSPFYQLELSTDYARKLTTSTWSTGSDERIKTDIESANVARCVEIVQNLDLKYFQWNIQSVTDTHSLGWIAQDLEKFFPKSVETAEAHGIPDFKNVNTDQLIKVMWGALKKLRADLKSQKSSGSALSTVGDSESPAPEQNL